MSCFIIPPSQCVLDDTTRYFICAICKNVAQGYQIHDGGFGQEYCQRPFCGTCISAYSSNAHKKALNKSGMWRVDCPIAGCTANLKQPMLREPSETEEDYYKRIRVKCQSCRNYLSPPEYLTHLPVCLSRLANAGADKGENSGQGGAVGEDKQADKLFISFNCTEANDKYVYGNLKKVPNSLVLKLFYENQMHRVQLSPGTETEQLMNKLKPLLGTNEDIKLVYLKHRSLIQSGSLKNFLKDLPIGTPINLTPFRKNMADPEKYICLHKL